MRDANTPTFRTETRIYNEESETAPFELLTLFDEGLIYDIELPQKSKITVFDISRNRIVLLDVSRKVKTVIAPQKLIDAMTDLRNQILQMNRGELFGLNTQPSADPKTGVYRAGIPGLLYISETEAESEPRMAKAYNEFATWAARMNVVAGRGAAPFVRLALGNKMAADGVVPKKITRTASRGDVTQTVRSEHVFISMLSQQDQSLIREIHGMLPSFKEVSRTEFSSPQIAQSK